MEACKKRILIVDDDTMVLNMLRGVLGKDYDVTTVNSGELAMSFLARKSTDIIFLDYSMPGENGPEVMDRIRSNPRTRNIPIVFLTGVSDSESVVNITAKNPDGYLMKPVERSRLIATVENLVK